MSAKAVKRIFPILFPQITPVSSLNLYSKSFLTIPVSRARAHIARLMSPGGSTQNLSLISPVVPPESVIAMIVVRFLSSIGRTFLSP